MSVVRVILSKVKQCACAGVVKDWLLIALSVLLFSTPVSSTSLVGYLIAFAGVKYWDARRVADIKNAANSKVESDPAQATSPRSPAADAPLLDSEADRASTATACGSPRQGASPRQSS